MDYERDTRLGYDHERAARYKRQQTSDLCWMRLTTWRERKLVAKCLTLCLLNADDRILDVPCGTGVMGVVFAECRSRVVAADVSKDMMRLAAGEYDGGRFAGFVQADILTPCFRGGSFSCVVTVGLMHRLPQGIRGRALKSIKSLSSRYVVVSFSIDDWFQRMKRRILHVVRRSYHAPPSLIAYSTLVSELRAEGFAIRKSFRVVPFLSSEIVLFLDSN